MKKTINAPNCIFPFYIEINITNQSISINSFIFHTIYKKPSNKIEWKKNQNGEILIMFTKDILKVESRYSHHEKQ